MAVPVLLNQINLILPKLNFHNQPNLSQWIALTKCPGPDGNLRVIPDLWSQLPDLFLEGYKISPNILVKPLNKRQLDLFHFNVSKTFYYLEVFFSKQSRQNQLNTGA